ELGHAGSGRYSARLGNIRRGVGNTALQLNAWRHLAVTWDGATVRYYRDGLPDGSAPFVGPLGQNDLALGLGGRPPAYAGGFPGYLLDGALDDVRVYTYALNDAEIAGVFALGAPPATDLDPPLRTDGAPSGSVPQGTLSVQLSLDTDEPAECRYSAMPGLSFDSMVSAFQVTGGTAHETSIAGIVDLTAYTFYVRCEDFSSNANGDDYAISFVTDGDPVPSGGPPKILDASGGGALPSGTTQNLVQVITDEVAECRYSMAYGTPFAAMVDVFQVTGGTLHTTLITGLQDLESYLVYVRCEDPLGDAMTKDFGVPFFVDGPAPAGFHPTDLDGVTFFVESRHGLTLARCPEPECFAELDTAAIAQQYCDTTTYPDGCVRRWQDQSLYQPPVDFEPPEWLQGHDFGQDDPDKPAFVPNCLNGYPCIRGGVGVTQELSFETEPNQPAGPIPGPFSLYLVARPVGQAISEWFYFGFAGSELRHRSSDDALRLRIAFDTVRTIAPAGSIPTGQWHMIEVHRDAADRIRTVVDGVEVTPGAIVYPGSFRFRYLFSVSRQRAMYGDMAAALVVDGGLSVSERARSRHYLRQLYDLALAGGGGGGGTGDLLAGWTFEDAGGCTLANEALGPDAVPGPNCPAQAPQPAAGAVGTALDFSVPGDEVVAGADPALDSLGALTVAAWVRTTANVAWRSIVDKRDAFADGFDLYLAPGGKPYVRLNSETLQAADSVADGEWHHLAFTYDGAEIVIYVDALPVASKAAPGLLLDTTNNLVLGRNFVPGFSQWVGQLDQVRIYDDALSPEEILALVAE
ncbi:MAG: LamG domain-containing protein, partial [Holophagales bacterium]|nr:LamG domain-containing protein [Holophagales bacterium]